MVFRRVCMCVFTAVGIPCDTGGTEPTGFQQAGEAVRRGGELLPSSEGRCFRRNPACEERLRCGPCAEAVISMLPPVTHSSAPGGVPRAISCVP
jgi:hypothetical protein